jgi:hypothetical protein
MKHIFAPFVKVQRAPNAQATLQIESSHPDSQTLKKAF